MKGTSLCIVLPAYKYERNESKGEREGERTQCFRNFQLSINEELSFRTSSPIF